MLVAFRRDADARSTAAIVNGRSRVGVACAAAVAALALAAPTPAAAAGYELARSWRFDSPIAIAVAGDDVFVARNTVSGCGLTRYTPRGDLVTSFSDGVGCPFGAAATPQGNIAVTAGPQIRLFDPNGTSLGAGTITNPSGDELTLNDVDIDAKGDQYVSYFGSIVDGYPGGIVRFSAGGQFLAAWDGEGSGDGQFGDLPVAVASDGRGNVYVADDSNYRIQKFTDTGTYVTQWGQLGTEPGEFIDPNAVAVDDRGDVYVADGTGAGRIQKFGPSGRLLAVIDIPAFVSSNPIDLDIDRRGNLYVADNGNPEAVYVFRPGGKAPNTKLTKAPRKKIRTRKRAAKVKVAFRSGKGARFECRLNKGRFKSCRSPYSVRVKSLPGRGRKHTIQVRATDAAGNVERKPAKVTFRLIRVG